ncbi:MAG: efflux RND transporter periplasmic adaptor subunit [Acidobacteria bacterium]|nr:efflux RND transporter periplasmic adaptor subunit [Acidobacteriota bacterium]
MKSLFLVLLLSSLLVLAGCTSEAGATDGSPLSPPEIREGLFTDRILLTGEVEAAVAETVSVPRLPSWQTSLKWLAEEGSKVSKGEKVAELDTASFASDLDSKIEARAEAEEKLRQHLEETRAELGEKEFDYLRRKKDYEIAAMNADVPREIISLKEYEERQLALERAKTELEKAKTLLESTRRAKASEQENLQLDLEEKQRQIAIGERAIETMTLYAPTDGVLVLNTHPWFGGRKVEVGDNVWVGFPIARIPDLDTLRVSADLFDVDDGRVKEGMRATVVIDAFPGRRFTGVVSRVSSVAEEEGGRSLRRVFKVLVELEGMDPTILRPGLSARVEIETNRVKDATIVPRAAIDFSGDTPRLALKNSAASEIDLIDCNSIECAVRLDEKKEMAVR